MQGSMVPERVGVVWTYKFLYLASEHLFRESSMYIGTLGAVDYSGQTD
jgi:hypothetical protein